MRNRDNPLIPAVKSGDIEALINAMAAEPTPTKPEIDEAYFLACEANQLELVKRLIRYGADVGTRDRQYNKSAIIRVVEEGYLELFTFLLKEGKASPYNRDNDEKTLLMYASDPSRLAFARLLLESDVLTDRRDQNGKTAIAYAIEKGNIILFNLLLDKKVALDVIDLQGRTLLMLAASGGHAVIASCLIARQSTININEKDAHGKTALTYAAENGHVAVVNGLLANSSTLGVVDGLSLLLTNAPECINAQDANGKTMLMSALDGGHLEAVQFLLERGANQQGQSLLMIAVINRNVDAAKFLFSQGANLHQVDSQGRSLLMLAVISQDVGMVAWLLENGANVNAVDRDSNTALMHAAKLLNHEILALLLDKNANVTMVNGFGWSALRLATSSGRSDNVKALLYHHRGSRVTVSDIKASWADPNKSEAVKQIFQACFKMHYDFRMAALGDNLNQVNRFISLGVNVNLHVEKSEQYWYSNPVYSVDNVERPLLLDVLIYSRAKNLELIVRALIEAGAELNISHGVKGRKFPLDLAAQRRSKALVEFMRDHGAKFYDEPNAFLSICCHGYGVPEMAEKVKYFLGEGMSLPMDWEAKFTEKGRGSDRKPLAQILVEFINEKIQAAFSSEFNANALQGLVVKINEITSRLSNQKSARALVRSKIEECVQAFTAALEGSDDAAKIANEEERIKLLSGLEVLKKKPDAKKEKTATLKLLDAVRHVEMLNAAAQATAESKALFATLTGWASKKPFTDKIEQVIANELLKPLDEKDQRELQGFLGKILNDDQRKALKKMVYDAIEAWSKKYKLEEEQAALVLTINKIKTSYDNEIPCALFELLRTSDSGRTNVDTGTWKDFVNAIKHGNYLKKQPEKLFGLFGGRKAPVKPSENEGMFSMKLLGSNKE